VGDHAEQSQEEPSHEATMAGLQGGWQRMHPLSPLVRTGRGLIPVVFILLIPSYGSRHGSGNGVAHIVILAVALAAAVVSWLVTRWRVEEGVLRVDSGLIRRTSERFPLRQIQAIDVVRPGLARLFGLAELRIRLASGGGKAGRLAYLNSAEAEALRGRLLELGRGGQSASPAVPERVLVSVPPARLLISLTLTRSGLAIEAALATLAVLAVVAPGAAAGLISAATALLIALAIAVFRRFNAGYRLTVTDAADGLRLRSGLVETTAETIPPGRIQAIRMIEPLIWRLFGWVRLDVDVASQKAKGRQDRDAAKAARSLLPVGTREEAAELVARLFPGLPSERRAPPRRALLKTPLRFHYLASASNSRYAVTTSGRARRATDWVPLSKVQSVRLVEGPVQRALRLSSIHLDTAGRSVHAVLRDRDREEASRLLYELPDLCRQARHREDEEARRGGVTSDGVPALGAT
jgi:putative membrane protein